MSFVISLLKNFSISCFELSYLTKPETELRHLYTLLKKNSEFFGDFPIYDF